MADLKDAALRTRIETFLQKSKVTRTSEERKDILASLGLRNPEKFLHSVWSTQWETGIDQLLNPNSLYFLPLDRSDFHFKWARGSFNALPQAVKARLFLLKMEPNHVFAALQTLFASIGISVDSVEIKNVDILDKIHSEAAVTVWVNGSVERTFEISHFNLAGEEIFSRIAELSDIRREPVHIYTTPHHAKVAFEMKLGQENLLSERWPPTFFQEYRDVILKEIAAQDAVGDALGTIGRDVHYTLTDTGQVYSFHHRELFHPVSDMTPGFFEPIYLFLSRKIEQSESGVAGHTSQGYEELYPVYRRAYLDKNQQLRGLWTDLQREVLDMRALIQEYFREAVDVKEVIDGVRSRIFLNTADGLDRIYALFVEE